MHQPAPPGFHQSSGDGGHLSVSSPTRTAVIRALGSRRVGSAFTWSVQIMADQAACSAVAVQPFGVQSDRCPVAELRPAPGHAARVLAPLRAAPLFTDEEACLSSASTDYLSAGQRDPKQVGGRLICSTAPNAERVRSTGELRSQE